MRRLATAVAASVLVALVASACGAKQNGQVTPGAQLPVAPPPSSAPAAPAEGAAVAQNQVDAKTLPADYPREVRTQDAGRTLVAHGQEGGCGKVRADVVEQSPSTVRVVFVETVPQSFRPCTMDLRYPALTIRLDQPLGNRTLVLESRTDRM